MFLVRDAILTYPQALTQIAISVVQAIITLAPSLLHFLGKIAGILILIVLEAVKILLPMVIFFVRVLAVVLPPIINVIVRIVSWFLDLFLLSQMVLSLGLKLLAYEARDVPLRQAPSSDAVFESMFKSAGRVALGLWDKRHWEQVQDFLMPLAEATRDHPPSATLYNPYVATHGLPYSLEHSSYGPRAAAIAAAAQQPRRRQEAAAMEEAWHDSARARGVRRLLDEGVSRGELDEQEADALYGEEAEEALASGAAATVRTLEERMEASRRHWAHAEADPHGAFLHSMESLLREARAESPVRAARRRQVLRNLEASSEAERNSSHPAPFSHPFPGEPLPPRPRDVRPVCQSALCGGKGAPMAPARRSLRERVAAERHRADLEHERRERDALPGDEERREVDRLAASAWAHALSKGATRALDILASGDFRRAAERSAASLLGEEFDLHDFVERQYYDYADGYHWALETLGHVTDWAPLRRVKAADPDRHSRRFVVDWKPHARMHESRDPSTGRRLLFFEMATADGGVTYVPLNDTSAWGEEDTVLVGAAGQRLLLANLPVFALFTQTDCYTTDPRNPLCLPEMPGSWQIKHTPKITYPSDTDDDSFCDPYFPCHPPRDLLDYRS